MASRVIAGAAGLSAALLFAAPAAASPLFEAAGGINGGGLNARFASPGVSSAYFNPAYLTQVERTISVSFLAMQDAVSMTLMGREGVDVPLDLLDATNPDLTGFEDGTFPTEWIEEGCDPQTGAACQRPLTATPRQSQGTSGDVGPYAFVGVAHQMFGPQFVVGLNALIPIGDFTGGHQYFVDEREQFFSNSLHSELHGDRLSAPSIAIAMASELIDGLSLGWGIGIKLGTDADADTFVIDGNDQSGTLQLSTKIRVAIGVAPYGSIAYVAPSGAGSITATVHSPNRFDVGVGVATLLADGDNQRAVRQATLDYMPWQFGLGGDLRLPTREGRRVTLTAGAVLRLWSNYVDRQSDRPSGAYEWADTISPSVGARWEEGMLRAGVDVSYTPTPIPLQTGRTNYVGNDQLGFAGNVSYGFDLPAIDFRIGLDGQLQRLLPRSQRKIVPDTTPGQEDRSLVIDEFPDDAVDTRRQLPVGSALGLQTNNPGWPGFESEGWLWGAGFNVELSY